jgi:hypothetical protein
MNSHHHNASFQRHSQATVLSLLQTPRAQKAQITSVADQVQKFLNWKSHRKTNFGTVCFRQPRRT